MADILLPGSDVRVAVAADRIVGVLATTPGQLDQLYMATSAQGHGIGSHLVRLTDGAGNEEREPDVLYRWESIAEGEGDRRVKRKPLESG